MVNEAARALARIDREVWVITSQARTGQRGGLLATWIQQVTLDDAQPTILIALHPNHYTRELVDASGDFVAHLLCENQVSLAIHFAASSGHQGDKLAGVDLEASIDGQPRLRHCAAWVRAKVYSRLATPDRIFYWAECIAGGVESTAPPLREAMFFKSLTVQERDKLQENRRKDLESVASAAAAWRSELPDFLRFSPPS